MGQTYVRMYACRRRWVERFVQASKRGSFAVGSVPPTLPGMHVCCPGHVTGCHGMSRDVCLLLDIRQYFSTCLQTSAIYLRPACEKEFQGGCCTRTNPLPLATPSYDGHETPLVVFSWLLVELLQEGGICVLPGCPS